MKLGFWDAFGTLSGCYIFATGAEEKRNESVTLRGWMGQGKAYELWGEIPEGVEFAVLRMRPEGL